MVIDRCGKFDIQYENFGDVRDEKLTVAAVIRRDRM